MRQLLLHVWRGMDQHIVHSVVDLYMHFYFARSRQSKTSKQKNKNKYTAREIFNTIPVATLRIHYGNRDDYRPVCRGGGYGGCNPPKFIRSKIFWVNLWQLYYSDSTVFKFCTIVATRCQILRLKCTKFDFGWGSAPDPAGGAYSAPPDPLAGF